MYAVIKTGGKQYRVEQGQRVRVESLPGQKGDTVAFPEVLLLADGDRVEVGAPVIEGATVQGQILCHGRHKKIEVFKMKRRKKSRVHRGHRQNFTEVEVSEIRFGAAE